MFFVDTIETEGLGSRCHLAGGDGHAVVVDPPRDIDRVIAAAAARGVRLTHVVETHLHEDHVTGGPDLSRLTGASYLVPAGARASLPHVPVHDGDRVPVGTALTLRALAAPGRTPHHTAYVLEESGTPVAVFTGGSLLVGAVGRPGAAEPRLAERLARAQYASVHRLAAELPDGTAVLPAYGPGSPCSSAPAGAGPSTVGAERAGNDVFAKDADTFVADLLAGLDDAPAHHARLASLNAAGPAPVDLTPPPAADAGAIAARLAEGEWVVDLRDRTAFARGHVAGSFNVEAGAAFAARLALLLPAGRPVTLLAETPERIAAAQRELVRVGVDRPAAAATGDPRDWVRGGEALCAYPVGTFAGLAEALGRDPHGTVVLDVRHGAERAAGHIEGSAHVPLHEVRRRAAGLPAGTVWVHCGTGARAAVAASLLDAAGREVVAVDDAFGAAAGAGLPVVRPACPRVTARQARCRTGTGGAVLLDVREEDEWLAGRAPGAAHAPLSALLADDRVPRVLRGRDAVVICRSGKRSQQAARLLAERGVRAVDVVGGMHAWAHAGYPVVDEDGNRGRIA